MNKIKHITDGEREKYGKIQGDISYSISKLMSVLPSEELNLRRFYSKLPILNDYVTKTKEIDMRADKKGVLDVFRSDEKFAEELKEYKNKIIFDLNKLEVCSKCKCLNCEEICPFSIKGCNQCNPTSKIINCDKVRYRIISHPSNLLLHDDDHDEEIDFKVLGILEDRELGINYIYLVHKTGRISPNGEEEFDERIFEYYKKTNGDVEYGNIETFEEINAIYQIFINLGVSL